jgi:hypothetical protein
VIFFYDRFWKNILLIVSLILRVEMSWFEFSYQSYRETKSWSIALFFQQKYCETERERDRERERERKSRKRERKIERRERERESVCESSFEIDIIHRLCFLIFIIFLFFIFQLLLTIFVCLYVSLSLSQSSDCLTNYFCPWSYV